MWNINKRLSAIIITAVVGVSLIISIINYQLFSNIMTRNFEKNIRITAKHFAAGAIIALLFKDKLLIKRMSKIIMQDPSVNGIEIQDKNGKLFFKEGTNSGRKIVIPLYTVESEESVLFVPSERKRLGSITIFYTNIPLLKAMRILILKISLAVIVVVILTLFVAHFTLSRAILNPLWNLLSAVREITKGNLDVEIKKVSLPEINELSAAFSEMLTSIKLHRKLLEESYENLAKQKAMAEIGKFSLMIAHEIKNPLGIIKGALDLLKKKEIDENTRSQLLSFIEEETARIDLLVKNFLELGRISQAEIQKVNVLSLLNNIKEKILVEYPDVEIIIESEEFTVESDPNKLQRIITNLITNSIEANATTIKIRTFIEKDTWGISVSDNGSGIKESEKEKIFTPFYTTKRAGTGLGLSLVAREVYLLNGKIDVESIEKKGTTFTIVFPRRHENGPYLSS